MNKALAELDNAIKCARLQEDQALACTVEWLEMIQESMQEALEKVERLRKMYEREREIAESAQKNAEFWKKYGENLQQKENLLTHAIQSLESIRDHSTDKASARAASEAVKLIQRIQEEKWQ